MSADPNEVGEFAVLLTADVTFMNIFQKNAILTHIITSLTFCNRFIIDHAGIAGGEIGSRYLLNADTFIINKSRYVTVSSASVRISRRKLPQTQQLFLWPQPVRHKEQFSYEDQSWRETVNACRPSYNAYIISV